MTELGETNGPCHRQTGFCPCCSSGLRMIQNDLVEISRLIARPLPASASSRLSSLMEDVRTRGRDMLNDLRCCFTDGRSLSYPVAFEKSVAALGGGIDALAKEGGARGLGEDGVFHLYALRFALTRLAADMRSLVGELAITPQAAGH